MKRKIALFLSLTLLSSLVLSSCGKVEYGAINDVDIQLSERTSEPAPPAQFSGTDNTLTYKYDKVNIGRAYMQLPYPRTWKMVKETDYDIKFIAPANDPYFPNACIYFHSTLEYAGPTEQEYLLEMFKQQIYSDKYIYGGASVSLAPSSYVEKYVVDTRTAEAEYDYQLSYRDYDAALTGKSFRNTTKEKPYFQKTVYTWYGFPCILSGLVEESKADQLYDLLVYMMSNSSYINDAVKQTRTATMFETSTNISFPVNTLYEQYRAEKGPFDKVAYFACSPNSGTGFSHSSIAAYEIKKKKFKKIESDTFHLLYFDTFLMNQFGVDSSQLGVHGYLDENMNGSMTFGNKTAKEYVYRFIIEDTTNQLPGTFDGQQWMIVLYPVEVGDKIVLIVLTTTESGLIWSFDNIELISKYITYGK